MKIVAISDTHLQHKKVVIPECDLLIHAGDFTCARETDITGTTRFLKWFQDQPAKHKVFIAGNHDALFEKAPNVASALVEDYNITYLQNSGCEVEGLKLWGSPYTPQFMGWSFMAGEDNHKDIKKYWDLIPDDTDILITHGPPRGKRDSGHKTRLGCLYLRERVDQLNLNLHVFGHIHSGHGQDGVYYNVSVLNDDYQLTNEPTIIEL